VFKARAIRVGAGAAAVGIGMGTLGLSLLAPGIASATPVCAGTPVAVHFDPSTGDLTGDVDAIHLDAMAGFTSGFFGYYTFWVEDSYVHEDGAPYTDADGRALGVTITGVHLVTADRPEGFDLTPSADGDWSYQYDQPGYPTSADATGCAEPLAAAPTTTTAAPTTTPTTTTTTTTTTTPTTTAVPTTTAPTATQATVAAPSVRAGGRQTIVATGFTPGERVRGTLHSTPVDLGFETADADGTVTFIVDLPADFEAGAHTVVMQGLTSGHTASASFTVTAAAPPGATASSATGELAYTGTSVGLPLAVGAGALALGTALTVYGHRRRATAQG
jgi:hypothetical protein